jgi:hypothetical protein
VALKKIQPISNGAFLIDVDRRIRYSSRTSVHVGRCVCACLLSFTCV